MAEGSITRTLRVLEVVCESGPLTLKELSERVVLSSPTLLRMLRLMAEEGYVVQLADRTWRATMLMWRLGCAVNATAGVSQLSREHTDRLTAELGETSVYAVYEQGSVTYAAHSEPVTPVRAHIPLGRQYHLLSTVTGQAVLAWLGPDAVTAAVESQDREGVTSYDEDEVRKRLQHVRDTGVASGPGVRWRDLWGAAAPVFDAHGAPIGALGVSLPVTRLAGDGTDISATVAREAASMTERVGGRRPVHSPAV